MTRQEEALSAIAGWNVTPVGPLEEIKEDRLFRIRTLDGQDLVLKSLEAGDNLNTPERLTLQHEILAHLATEGVGVSKPIRHPTGKTWTEYEGRLYVLSPWLDASGSMGGTDPTQLIPNWGRAVAELHLALSVLPVVDFESRTWRNKPMVEIFDQCLPTLARLSPKLDLRDRLPTRSELEGDMRNALENLPEQLIHRDCHPENLVRNGNEVVGFVDCDHFSIGSPAHDVGYFLIRMVQWYFDVTTDEWLGGMGSFLTAYHSRRRLSQAECKALPHMMVYVLVMSAERYAKLGSAAEVIKELDAVDFVRSNVDRIQALISID